jgi:hypothetical protein
VILPARQYDRLLEDIHDPAVVAERREEKTVSAADVRKRLKKDGLL